MQFERSKLPSIAACLAGVTSLATLSGCKNAEPVPPPTPTPLVAASAPPIPTNTMESRFKDILSDLKQEANKSNSPIAELHPHLVPGAPKLVLVVEIIHTESALVADLSRSKYDEVQKNICDCVGIAGKFSMSNSVYWDGNTERRVGVNLQMAKQYEQVKALVDAGRTVHMDIRNREGERVSITGAQYLAQMTKSIQDEAIMKLVIEDRITPVVTEDEKLLKGHVSAIRSGNAAEAEKLGTARELDMLERMGNSSESVMTLGLGVFHDVLAPHGSVERWNGGLAQAINSSRISVIVITPKGLTGSNEELNKKFAQMKDRVKMLEEIRRFKEKTDNTQSPTP